MFDRVRRLDPWLLLAIAGLLTYSGLFVYSAVYDPFGDRHHLAFFYRQCVWMGLGLGVFLVLALMDYRVWDRAAYLIYGANIVLLIVVFFTRARQGAQSWINLGFFSLQPSEFMKVSFLVALAHYLLYKDSYRRLTGLVAPFVLIVIPLVLILKQPDLGTALVFPPILFVVLYAAGARPRHLAAIVLAVALAAPVFYLGAMNDEQRSRISGWLHAQDPRHQQDAAWQLLRSLNAVACGGVWGTGWRQGAQHALTKLPEKHSDFIFAVIAEEWGLVGGAGLLSLYLIICLRGLALAGRTREPFGRLVAIGVVAMLATQVYINLGVTIGLLPTTGITLPLVSYGGSSMLSSFIALGLLQSVDLHRPVVLAQEDFF